MFGDESETESSTWVRGAYLHPDPDVLVAYRMGQHEYVGQPLSDVRQAYVDGELGLLEYEAILDGVFDRHGTDMQVEPNE